MSFKKVFLEIRKTLRKTPVSESLFLIFNLLVLGGNKRSYVLKKTHSIRRLRHRCFPLNFAKLLRTPYFIEHLRCLHLNTICAHDIFLKPYRETGNADFFQFLMVLNEVESYSTAPPLHGYNPNGKAHREHS